MQTESVPLLQLMQAKGIGSRSLARVLDRLEQDKVSLREFVALEPEEMVRFDLKEDQARAIHTNEEPAVRTAELLEDHRIRTIMRSSSEYPERSSVLGSMPWFCLSRLAQSAPAAVGFAGHGRTEEACAGSVSRLAQHRLARGQWPRRRRR